MRADRHGRGGERALQAGFDAVKARYDGTDELPKKIDERLGELETAIARFEQRPLRFARAGVFISIDENGDLDIERGFVRPEDDVARGAESAGGERVDGDARSARVEPGHRRVPEITVNDHGSGASVEAEPEDDDALRPLSDRLVTELTAHQTLAHPRTELRRPASFFPSRPFSPASAPGCFILRSMIMSANTNFETAPLGSLVRYPTAREIAATIYQEARGMGAVQRRRLSHPQDAARDPQQLRRSRHDHRMVFSGHGSRLPFLQVSRRPDGGVTDF